MWAKGGYKKGIVKLYIQIMSGEGGLTTETELSGTIPLDADQVTDITRKGWQGQGFLVLMELDE